MNTLFTLFLKGLIFGITMAAIPGPILFLIIQRTLTEGILVGFACGLGAVSADTVYALIAIAGLSVVTQFFLAYQTWLAIAGGLFLVYLGITTLRQEIKEITPSHEQGSGSLVSAWFTTFLLTITNPITIVAYGMIFAALGGNKQSETYAMMTGVILGAIIIFLGMVGFLAYFRQKIPLTILSRINKIAGLILIGFGLTTLYTVVRTYNSVMKMADTELKN